MLTHVIGGKVYDPSAGWDGVVKDLYIQDDRIVDTPREDTRIDRIIDAKGLFIMSGGIDIHSHIGGGKVNIARMMLTEDCDSHHVEQHGILRSGSGKIVPSTFITGYEYAKLGYTMCFEPAIVPSNARQAHLEMADTPLLDTGGYVILGNDDYFLRLLAQNADLKKIRDYVGWMLEATQCIGVKAVNPGGINAFKFNQRKLDVDEQHEYYGVTPAQVVRTLTSALGMLNVSHPLHIHTSNLGVAGNFASTIATTDAADGHRMHLAHAQFHSYGKEGKNKFSSAAMEIAERVNTNPQLTLDVGHIMFGQTVTVSADTMHQYANQHFAHPRKSTFVDIECEAGCGVVPFRYRSKEYVNALQWTIGLELFLSIENKFQVMLTTDHPNGASFTSYPHLIRLLMDKNYRNEMLSKVHKGAVSMSYLKDMDQEYSLYDIATITRAGPARSLGLHDRGHLQVGAIADVVFYRADSDWESVFRNPVRVIKAGETVVLNGEVVKVLPGNTSKCDIEYDRGVEKDLHSYFDEHYTVRLPNFKISSDEMANSIGSETVSYRSLD